MDRKQCMIRLDKETFEDLLLYAVSYCITRQSYANGDGEKYARAYFEGLSKPMQKCLFQRVYEAYPDMSVIDKANWQRTLEWMQGVIGSTLPSK